MQGRRSGAVTVVVTLLLSTALGVAPASAADGALDSGFDGEGMLTSPIAGGGDEARSVAIQANGRIVVAGTDSGERFAVIRYRANGALDDTFEGDGVVRTDLTEGDDVGYDVAIQVDGKILVVGSAGTQPGFAVVRYLRDGILDLTFGGDGIVRRVVNQIFPLDVAVQSNGRIVVGGDFDIFARGVARFTAGGRLDDSFGGDGKVATSFGDGTFARGVAARSDGAIVAVGGMTEADVLSFALARYLAETSSPGSPR